MTEEMGKEDDDLFEEEIVTEEQINQKLKFSPFIKNIKTGEIKLKELKEILQCPSDWVKTTQKEYEEYQNKIKEKNYILDLLDNNKERIVEEFYKYQPFFYDKTNIFWLWNHKLKCYEIKDELDFIIKLKEMAIQKGSSCVGSKFWGEITRAVKVVGRAKIPKDAPVKWVQFNDKAISIISNKVYDITPDYFFTNPIPWKLGKSIETPILDKLFSEWVRIEDVPLLYEILAYSCFRDYTIHRIFCLVGCGRNGKSTFLAIMGKFLGENNYTSTELDNLIDNRFESFKLYRKLCCIIGETNFSVMSKTSIIKKLSGNDPVGVEMKGKTPFDMRSYAKLIIASNSLPTSMDTSDGLYSRMLVINFDNQFKEGRDILSEIPDIEFENLAYKIKTILPKLLKKGGFTNEGTIEERKKKYIENSNPVSLFISEECYIDKTGYVKYGDLYTRYVSYLLTRKKRKVTMKEFKDVLENEGYYIYKESKKINDDWVSDRFINGICLKQKNDIYDTYDSNLPLELHIETNCKKVYNCHKTPKEEEIIEFPKEIEVSKLQEFDFNKLTYHKCKVQECGNQECNFDVTGTPYCHKHWDLMAIKK